MSRPGDEPPTFQQSLALLGVGLDAGKRGARRAYLRLLKLHKPEHDPEGFKALRAAYEHVDREIEWWAALAAAEGSTEVEPAIGSEVDAERTSLTAEPIAVPHPAPDLTTDQNDIALVTGQPRIPAWARAEAAEFAADHEHLTGGGGLDEERLAVAFGASFHIGVAYAEELLETDRVDAAATVVVRLLAVAQLHPEVEAPYCYYIVQLILGLGERGAVSQAHAATRALERWIVATGSGALLGDEVAAIWALAREVDQLADTFPLEARCIIAKAIRAGSLPGAWAPLHDFAEREPDQAEVARALLFHRSPNLHFALSDALRARYISGRAVGRRLQRWGWFGIIVACFAVVAHMAGGPEEAARRSLDRILAREAATAVRSAAALRELCLRGTIDCTSARQVVERLDQRDCTAGVSAQAEALRRDAVGSLQTAVATAVVRRYRDLCKDSL